MFQFARVVASQAGIESYERRLSRELSLAELMRNIKAWKRQSVQIDTRAMGCPFRLYFSPFRP